MASPRTTDLVSGALVALAGGGIWLYTRSFPTLRDGHPGPALFPAVVAIAFIICGGALLVQGARRSAPPHAAPSGTGVAWDGVLRLVAGVVLALLYPLLQERIGFIPTVGALIFGVAILLRARLLPSLVVAFAGTAVIYLAFTRLLGVPL